MKTIEEIENYALLNDIPIMQKEGINYLISLIQENHYTHVLEIGSAIGYSSIMMAINNPDCLIETIERDSDRAKLARENIKEYASKQVILYEEDALELDESKLLNNYDLIFIDAAKAQYQKFFEKYISYLKEDGIVVVDNLDFHGMIYDIEHIKNRNTRALVRKIKRFKDWIFNHEAFDAHYLSIGDGLCIIQRKKETDETHFTPNK